MTREPLQMTTSDTSAMTVTDELALLGSLVPLADRTVIELGCGSAGLARRLLAAHPGARVTGLEVDKHQHAKNLLAPAERLTFVQAGAEAIPCEDHGFDLALMLNSLHHVPLSLMDPALTEVARVLKPGGMLYVSEPVYAGPENEVIRLFNDEGEVRAAALAALRRAEASPLWQAAGEWYFELPVHYVDCADFERRMVDVTFAERCFDDTLRAAVRVRLAAHMTPDGAHFMRPMRANLLRKRVSAA